MNRIVSFALRQRVLIVVLLVMMLGAGVASFVALNIEAYPDPVPPLVAAEDRASGAADQARAVTRTVLVERGTAGWWRCGGPARNGCWRCSNSTGSARRGSCAGASAKRWRGSAMARVRSRGITRLFRRVS